MIHSRCRPWRETGRYSHRGNPFDIVASSLGIIDLTVLIAAVGVAIGIGLRMSGKQDSVESFFLGNRNLPWWAILGSIVATETSTATVLSLPAQGYGPTGMKFLQIALGFFVGRALVVWLLLPRFFDGWLYSAYDVLQRRFGSGAQRTASLLFLVTRNLGDGLRLFLAGLVLQKMVGWDFVTSALVIGGVTVLYTCLGGMRSVIWNDCIQWVIYMTGGLVSVFVIVAALPEGWQTVSAFAAEQGKLEMLAIVPNGADSLDGGTSLYDLGIWLISSPYTLWAGLLGGAVLTLGTHGTDQMMVQRYLSARSQRDAARAVLASAVVVFVQFALFLFIGVLLACYYAQGPLVEFGKPDEVYVHFIVHSFPANTGLVGLMLAAILAAAMSTLSSSLNSSASAVLNDFYLPRRTAPPDPRRLVWLSRGLSVGFGAIQIGIGIWATTFDQTVIRNALTIAGYSAGILLGLFLLGILTVRVGQVAALAGAVVGAGALLSIQFGLPCWGIQVAWPWYALIGAGTTFGAGWFASWFTRQPG